LFKRREERTLSAAVQFYCGRDHESAHDASGDVLATWDVWRAQLAKYGLANADRETLERESNYEEKRVDLAGKIVIGKDGRPTYNIGKVKGTAVVDDTGFACWMLDRDFSANTKIHLRKILEI
jgi:DNA polymerase-3 subunit epsilon